MKTVINSLTDLMAALNNNSPANLELQTSILCPYSITLPAGFSLTGANKESCIISFNNSDGIGLTANNEVANLTIQANPNNRAIYTLSNYPDLGIFNALSFSDCRPQWSILTPQRLYCGYLGDAAAIDHYEKQLLRFQPTRWRRQTFEADEEFRWAHWRAVGDVRLRATVPPARIADFASAAGLTQWIAEPAFGVVLAGMDRASVGAIQQAAASVGGSAVFDFEDSFDWSPPAGQRAILERLKRFLDPHNRLVPLPWERNVNEFDAVARSPAPG